MYPSDLNVNERLYAPCPVLQKKREEKRRLDSAVGGPELFRKHAPQPAKTAEPAPRGPEWQQGHVLRT